MKIYDWKKTECFVCGKVGLKEWTADNAGRIACSDKCDLELKRFCPSSC